MASVYGERRLLLWTCVHCECCCVLSRIRVPCMMTSIEVGALYCGSDIDEAGPPGICSRLGPMLMSCSVDALFLLSLRDDLGEVELSMRFSILHEKAVRKRDALTPRTPMDGGAVTFPLMSAYTRSCTGSTSSVCRIGRSCSLHSSL